MSTDGRSPGTLDRAVLSRERGPGQYSSPGREVVETMLQRSSLRVVGLRKEHEPLGGEPASGSGSSRDSGRRGSLTGDAGSPSSRIKRR